jgi:hypothetical protein
MDFSLHLSSTHDDYSVDQLPCMTGLTVAVESLAKDQSYQLYRDTAKKYEA